MMLAVDAPQVIASGVVFLTVGAVVFLGWRPMKSLVLGREDRYGNILRRHLLIDIQPRTVSWLTAAMMLLLGALGFAVAGGQLGVLGGLAIGAFLPGVVIRFLRQRRLRKLEDQLVSGIQTLSSGVRAGLNLVQSMEMVARDGPVPLRQEFQHLLREYEYGTPFEEAMDNAADRVGSGDFRLLFAALHTHRDRGGDLGQTLDRIADSIREIQRLEHRLENLTAEGRATARWLGLMPAILLGIYYLIDSSGVRSLFSDPAGNIILLVMVVLNIAGFLWVKKVVSIDI